MADYMHQRVVVRKKLQGENLWVDESNGFVIEDVMNPKADIGLGKKRDGFNFDARNPSSKLYEKYFDGDGSTVAFTLEYYPIPSEHLSGDFKKFDVYVGGSLKEYTTDYAVSGSTLTFTSAPTTGNRNIRIVYPVIETDDLVDIYFWKNADFSSLTQSQKNSARAIEGIVAEPTLNRGANVISVRGYGLIDTIFSGMAFALTDNADEYAHTIIQKIIAQLNQFNPNRPIFGEDAAQWATIGNDTVEDTTSYSSKYRTAIEMIEELSSAEHTDDGQYIYWVDYNPRTSTTTSTSSGKLIDSTASFTAGLQGLTVYNETDGTNAVVNSVDSATQLTLSSDIFISGEAYAIPTYDFNWKAKPTDSTSTLTEGIEPNNIKISKPIDGVVNVVIANVGNDCYGNGQEYLYYDFTITGYGSRWKYVSETSTIAQNIIKGEFENNQTYYDTGDEDEPTSNFPNNYNNSGSGYWNFQFVPRVSISDATYTTNADKNVTTDKAFNKVIRIESFWQGKAATQRYINLFSNPRFKATLFFPYTSDVTPVLGDVYELTFPSFALNNRKLRLIQVQKEFYGQQWILEEDEKTLEGTA